MLWIKIESYINDGYASVQLAVQSYSARVIEVFSRTPDLWILMGIYGVAIFYGLGVLKLIEKAKR